MAVTTLVLTLIEEFARDLRRPLTIRRLAKNTGKAYPNVHATTHSLLQDGVLIKETVGHSHNCRLNLANDTTKLYLGLVQLEKKKRLLLTTPTARATISRLEHRPGIVLAWFCKGQPLIVTRTQEKGTLPLNTLLNDEELWSTIGEHTLLIGHATYVDLLQRKEVEK